MFDRSIDREAAFAIHGTEESARSAGDIFATGYKEKKEEGGEEKRAFDLPCMRIRWNIASSAGFEWPTGYSSGWLLVLVNIAGPLMRNSRECLRFSASYVQFCTAVAFPERQMAGSDVSFRLLIKSFQPFSSVDLHLGGGGGKRKKKSSKKEGFQKTLDSCFHRFSVYSVKRKKNIVDDFKKKKREREGKRKKQYFTTR